MLAAQGTSPGFAPQFLRRFLMGPMYAEMCKVFKDNAPHYQRVLVICPRDVIASCWRLAFSKAFASTISLDGTVVLEDSENLVTFLGPCTIPHGKQFDLAIVAIEARLVNLRWFDHSIRPRMAPNSKIVQLAETGIIGEESQARVRGLDPLPADQAQEALDSPLADEMRKVLHDEKIPSPPEAQEERWVPTNLLDDLISDKVARLRPKSFAEAVGDLTEHKINAAVRVLEIHVEYMTSLPTSPPALDRLVEAAMDYLTKQFQAGTVPGVLPEGKP
jgi:hypothetical protein